MIQASGAAVSTAAPDASHSPKCAPIQNVNRTVVNNDLGTPGETSPPATSQLDTGQEVRFQPPDLHIRGHEPQ